MDVGNAGRVFVSVNTLSKRNREAGFDPRVRVGILREAWKNLPERGAQACQGFDYSAVEGRANVYFEHYERGLLEDLLLETTRRAMLLEVWGTPYFRRYRAGFIRSIREGLAAQSRKTFRIAMAHCAFTSRVIKLVRCFSSNSAGSHDRDRAHFRRCFDKDSRFSRCLHWPSAELRFPNN